MQIQFTPFPELFTERLHLRQLAFSDEQEIYIQRSDARILQYIDRPKANNLEDAREFIQKIHTNIAENQSIYCVFEKQPDVDRYDMFVEY
ncbi:MAG: hypothetical protein IPL27_07305 [Lewinellaceae bacterium]|nr:hypothetical protein [Lewinellaceae bacterium]